MNLLDNHVHTHFSIDGKDTVQDIIKEVINKEMMFITITDHLEYNTDRFSLNCKEYLNTIEYYKEKYENNSSILKRIQIAYQKHIKNEIEEIINTNNFDFVLCSTYEVEGIDVPDKLYFDNLTKEQSYNRYFERIQYTVTSFKNFDTYGHLDYLVRYSKYIDNKVVYDDFKDILDKVLKTIIHSGKGIELNT